MTILSTQEACECLRCERRKLKRLAQDHGRDYVFFWRS